MLVEETARCLLSKRDYEVAEYAVRLLRELPGIRTPEIQAEMENAAWMNAVDLMELEAMSPEDLALTRDEYDAMFISVKLTQRPEWRPIEGYVMHLTTALEHQRVLGSCMHLARLRWARVRDFKKMRRELWGEARYAVIPGVVAYLWDPYGPWMVGRYEEEMAKTTWDRKKAKTRLTLV